MSELADDPQTLPAPSAELVLFRVHVEATVSVLGRKKGERYLRLMAETISREADFAQILQLRPGEQHAEVRKARRQAAAIFQGFMPFWLARLPPR